MQKICFLLAGGTILMEKDEKSGVLLPSVNTQLTDAIPELKQIADIDVISLFSEDSSDLTPVHWEGIAKAVQERYDQYAGFVIVHGTDTMAYTASALSFALQQVDKPIVLTGSQIPITEIRTDAKHNILTATQVACEDIAEVCIAFGDSVIRGVRSSKTSEFNLDAFSSLNIAPLGNVGLQLRWDSSRIKRAKRKLAYAPNFSTDVVNIKPFPGLKPYYLDGYVTKECRGVFIEGFGAGNLPSKHFSLLPLINQWVEQGKLVVIGTQCLFGTADYEMYRGGNESKKLGALTSLDMTSETALVKLMWVLGNTRDRDEAKELYQRNLVGEIAEEGRD